MKIDLKQLKAVCNAPIPEFKALGDFDTFGRFVHRDNDSKILGVAHLDTVINSDYFAVGKDPDLIFSPNLDDRLGVYTLIRLSEVLDFDMLLTTDEERMKSTAMNFDPRYRSYNWIFEFDRAGTDVVMYQFEDHKSVKRLKRVGYSIGIGSYSDICELDHLGCKAFNFGVGYYRQHTMACHMSIRDWQLNVSRFVDFYHRFSKLYMPHDFDDYYLEDDPFFWHDDYYRAKEDYWQRVPIVKPVIVDNDDISEQ